MQKITPHLWFDTQAKQAAEFYTSIFPNSSITNDSVIEDTPSGDTAMLSFNLNGFEVMAISAGPEFTITPSLSFMVNFDPSQDDQAAEHIDAIWGKLIDGGEAMMDIGEYPFAKRYGWVKDKFGMTWQLILTNPEGEPRPYIMPSFLFTGQNYGKAVEAMEFYISTFKNSGVGMKSLYEQGMGPNKAGTLAFADFRLEDQWFTIMDGGGDHDFTFSEGLSLMVHCTDQGEIDELWNKLSAVPESEQCGWLKDKFGVSWQIVPNRLGELMSSGTPEQSQRVVQAFLKMKKFDIAELEKAFEG